VILFSLGIIFAFLMVLASNLLGDRHPVAKVGGWPIWKRLTRIIPQPVHIAYGIPFGALLGFWGVLLAGVAAVLYEHFGEFTNPYFEFEDVRDVMAGAIFGAIAALVAG
jgi:hypothetical protein